MNKNISFEVKDWKETIYLSIQLSKNVKESPFTPDVIIGILRGGAVVSRIVSDYLGVDLYSMKATLYDGIGDRDEVEISQDLNVDVAGKKVLIVDDIVDTGKTFSAVEKYIQGKTSAQIRGAVIHVKPLTNYVPHFWLEQTKKWVVYPWEFREFLRLAEEKLHSEKTHKENKKKFKDAVQEVKHLLNHLKKCDNQ